MLAKPRWSPYVVGALLGVLSWITFATMDKALGTSTTMVRAVGAAERVTIDGDRDADAAHVRRQRLLARLAEARGKGVHECRVEDLVRAQSNEERGTGAHPRKLEASRSAHAPRVSSRERGRRRR